MKDIVEVLSVEFTGVRCCNRSFFILGKDEGVIAVCPVTYYLFTKNPPKDNILIIRKALEIFGEAAYGFNDAFDGVTPKLSTVSDYKLYSHGFEVGKQALLKFVKTPGIVSYDPLKKTIK